MLVTFQVLDSHMWLVATLVEMQIKNIPSPQKGTWTALLKNNERDKSLSSFQPLALVLLGFPLSLWMSCTSMCADTSLYPDIQTRITKMIITLILWGLTGKHIHKPSSESLISHVVVICLQQVTEDKYHQRFLLDAQVDRCQSASNHPHLTKRHKAKLFCSNLDLG